MRLRGNNTTLNDICALLDSPYVVFHYEPTGWYVMVDLESNKEADGARAIPPTLPLSWGLPRGNSPHLVLNNYVRKAQARKRAAYKSAVDTLRLLTTFGITLETSGEVERLTSLFPGGYRASGAQQAQAEFFTARGIPLIQSVLPCAEGDPEVPEAPPVLSEEVAGWLSVMRKDKLQSLEELTGLLAVQKAAIRECLELNKIGTKDCVYRVWG